MGKITMVKKNVGSRELTNLITDEMLAEVFNSGVLKQLNRYKTWQYENGGQAVDVEVTFEDWKIDRVKRFLNQGFEEI